MPLPPFLYSLVTVCTHHGYWAGGHWTHGYTNVFGLHQTHCGKGSWGSHADLSSVGLSSSSLTPPGEERALQDQAKMTGKEEGKCRSQFHHQTLEIDPSIGSENMRPSGLSLATLLQQGIMLGGIKFWKELYLESELCVRVCWLLMSCCWASLDLGAVDHCLCRHVLIVHPPKMSESLVWALGRPCLT